jgi:integrase
LPKTLTAEEIEQLLGALGQSGQSMRRADAIVRCALDLGLRSGEIARIGLDDINWRAGTITLRHTKGRRDDVLPLPAATGKAIAAYLKHERPETSNRAVVVRHVAPRDVPVGPDLVRNAPGLVCKSAHMIHVRVVSLQFLTNRVSLTAGGATMPRVRSTTRRCPSAALRLAR